MLAVDADRALQEAEHSGAAAQSAAASLRDLEQKCSVSAQTVRMLEEKLKEKEVRDS